MDGRSRRMEGGGQRTEVFSPNTRRVVAATAARDRISHDTPLMDFALDTAIAVILRRRKMKLHFKS